MLLPKPAVRFLEDLDGLVKDNVDQALEMQPSPERAQALTEAILDEVAFKRIQLLVKNYGSAFRK